MLIGRGILWQLSVEYAVTLNESRGLGMITRLPVCPTRKPFLCCTIPRSRISGTVSELSLFEAGVCVTAERSCLMSGLVSVLC